MNSRTKHSELVKNTIIIFISKFCTQFISFLLIPVYTKFLDTSDYGYVDLIQSYISLIIPIVLLRMDSAIFRFLIDVRRKNEKQSEIISSTLCLAFIQIIFSVFFACIVNLLFNIKYFLIITINIIILLVFTIVLQIARGFGKNINYSVSCIISGLSNVVISSVLIIAFSFDSRAVLIASSIGNILAIIYLCISIRLYNYFSFRLFNKTKLVEMIKYSLPMIPDGLSWWIVGVSDRTIISFVLGGSMNGIYAISSKFANVMQSLTGVFNITWQESASIHIDDDDKDVFFSEILENNLKIFSSVSIIIMSILPMFYKIIVGASYINSYYFIPILLVGNIFNALSNVVGATYIAKKETKKAAKTTLFGAFINIFANLLLIRLFGLWAAAFSTLLSYIVLFAYRLYDTKKYVSFSIKNSSIIISCIVLFIAMILYYINNWISIILNVIICCIYIYKMNGSIIKKTMLFIKKKLNFMEVDN